MRHKGDKSDVVIIGGVAAGSKTAATLARRRPETTITLFQKETLLSYASCGFPYFASGEVGSFEQLLQTPYGVTRNTEFFEQARGFQAVTSSEVVGINRKNKTVTVTDLKTGETFSHGYGKLVFSTGAEPNTAPFPVAESDRIRPFTSPEDTIAFRRMAERGEIGETVIVGGGFIGVELCEAVKDMWGMDATLYEVQPQLLPWMLDAEMAAILRRSLVSQEIDVNINARVEKIEVGEDGKPVVFVEGHAPKSTDFVFLCLGVTPRTGLARDCGLAIGDQGGIVVDATMRTSDEFIYAGGDCVESIHGITRKPCYLPMGSLANRHGRVIAENLAGGTAEFPGVLGAFVLRAFETNIGGVGLNEQAAGRGGFETGTVWGSFPDRPDYNPEVKTMTLKMVYETESGKLLGLQAIGKGDICRRIDVFSALLQKGGRLGDLLDFEHCYAPPFSDALDPLHHMAGIALATARHSRFVGPGSVAIDPDTLVLDVREEEEAEKGPLTAAEALAGSSPVVIPLTQLRKRLGELESLVESRHPRRILVVCARGPRSYQASLVLNEAGFGGVEVLAAGLQAQ
jgi:NADPH-dependent 2,4-dienoyl-CoA reductase/sulfur reductase-like enzyme/rhodanese-related sulfurtransferase